MASQPEGREFKFWLRIFFYLSSSELKALGGVSGCWLIDTKFYIKLPGVGGLKSCSNGPGHVIT